MTSKSLEDFLDGIVKSVQRVGPPKIPTMFAENHKGMNVAVLADDPVASAREMIRVIKPSVIVVASTATDDSVVHFHAENKESKEIVDHVYSLPAWELVDNEVVYTPFDNLLGIKN